MFIQIPQKQHKNINIRHKEITFIKVVQIQKNKVIIVCFCQEMWSHLQNATLKCLFNRIPLINNV